MAMTDWFFTMWRVDTSCDGKVTAAVVDVLQVFSIAITPSGRHVQPQLGITCASRGTTWVRHHFCKVCNVFHPGEHAWCKVVAHW